MSLTASSSARITMRLVWHRKGDLRLHDNELYHVQQDGRSDHGSGNNAIVKSFSLYIIDPKDYEPRDVSFVQGTKENQASMTSSLIQTVTEGPHASRALIEALTNLRENLQTLGGDLLIRRGDPLKIVPEMAEILQAQELVWSEVPGYYESQLSENLKIVLGQNCQGINKNDSCSIRTVAGYTLWHPDDLPQGTEVWSRLSRPKEQKSNKKKKKNTTATDIESESSSMHKSGSSSSFSQYTIDCSPQRLRGIPLVMGDFRRAARTAACVRPCFPPPSSETIQEFSGNGHTIEHLGELPTMTELTAPYQGCSLLGLPASTIDFLIQCASSCTATNRPHHFNFGETLARRQWEYFLQNHAATADRSLADTTGFQSAHISTFLALGVLSPRHIYWSVLENSQHHSHTEEGCQWLISHMEMRDYFLYSALAANGNLYNLHGQRTLQKSNKRGNGKGQQRNAQGGQMGEWKNPVEHLDQFTKWATGNTGIPLVDAGMKELMTTGYCSNRVRQNMASVLTKDLLLDWRAGAEWFQLCLVDHCVAANWGNWRYFSGVGGDPKNRHFRTVSQAIRYDPTGSYVRKWLPRLRQQEEEGEEEDRECYFRPWDVLEDWPDTLVDPTTQYTWRDRQRLEETGRVIEPINNSESSKR